MDDRKRMSGKPHIYNGEQDEFAKDLERRRREALKKRTQKLDGPEQKETGLEKESTEPPETSGARSKIVELRAAQPKPTEPKSGRKSEQADVPVKNTGKNVRAEAETMKSRMKPLGDKIEKGAENIRRPEILGSGSKRRREQENELKMQILAGVLVILIIVLAAAIIYEIVLGHGTKATGSERMAEKARLEQPVVIQQSEAGDVEPQTGQTAPQTENQENLTEATGSGAGAVLPDAQIMQSAQLMTAQYDYDGAIELLKNTQGFSENEEYKAAVSDIEKAKNACVAYPANQVTHIFFHTLIHDPKKAFDGDEYEGGYNQFMVTEHEFNSIIQQMYEKGYVMVFLDDIAPGVEDENGNKTFSAKDILLPPDKIPFVLSQDDVSYYHYMDGDGFASRLILDENGDVKNEYIEEDGSVSVGDYDMVPLIDRFVEEHPDFSYHGAKGYIALTGYEGILGYRTDEVYKTKEEGRVTPQQQMFFDSYPGGFDEAAFEKECEGAKAVAEAMKKNGWKFASHTWGHQNMHETDGIPFDKFVRDTDRWENWVEPLIGETDTLIYAFGGDIRGAEKYSGDRFDYLKQSGFDYFCGVDSAKYWLQVEPNYVRQSRRNVDGYRIYYNPDMLSDLFDVGEAWDPLRPSSVPPL